MDAISWQSAIYLLQLWLLIKCNLQQFNANAAFNPVSKYITLKQVSLALHNLFNICICIKGLHYQNNPQLLLLPFLGGNSLLTDATVKITVNIWFVCTKATQVATVTAKHFFFGFDQAWTLQTYHVQIQLQGGHN